MLRFCFCFQMHGRQLCLVLESHSFWFQTHLVSKVNWRNSGKPRGLLIKQRRVNNIVNTLFRCLQRSRSLKISRTLLHFSLRCQGQFRNWEENFRNRNLCCHITTYHDSAVLRRGVTLGKTTDDFWKCACFSFLVETESGRWVGVNK